MHSDATAAIGIRKRRGLGKIRHLHTADLWVQERTRNGDIELLKVLGTENPADAFTKYGAMEAALKGTNQEFRNGRALGAPDISAQPPLEFWDASQTGRCAFRASLGCSRSDLLLLATQEVTCYSWLLKK